MNDSEQVPCLTIAEEAAAIRFPLPHSDDADAHALALAWQHWAMHRFRTQLNGYMFDGKVTVLIGGSRVANPHNAFAVPQEQWMVAVAEREKLLSLFGRDGEYVRPVFDLPARPVGIHPLLKLLPEDEPIIIRMRWQRNSEATSTPAAAIKHLEEAIDRQTQGWFTLWEAAQVLAEARPGMSPVETVRDFLTAHSEGVLPVHRAGSRFLVRADEAVSDWRDLLDVAELDSWLRATAKYGFPTAPASESQAVIDTEPVSHKKQRRSWQDAAWAYMVEQVRAGKFATAVELNHALHLDAGRDGSPFEKGEGQHRGRLWVREVGKPLAVKTIQNHWAALLRAAKAD